jgi:hypothetical protein
MDLYDAKDEIEDDARYKKDCKEASIARLEPGNVSILDPKLEILTKNVQLEKFLPERLLLVILDFLCHLICLEGCTSVCPEHQSGILF